jgi:hypothetical protein
MKRWYTIGWIAWLGIFAALESTALANHADGDTLSENVWAWFHVLEPHPTPLHIAGRGVLALFLLWLLFHMVMGWFTPSRPIPGQPARRSFMVPSTPTQTRHPWRATLRTVLAAGLALLPLLPTIADVAHVQAVPIVAGVLVVAGAITRILAAPGVDRWVRRWVPWLAASPTQP